MDSLPGFSIPVQTSSETRPAPCTMNTGISSMVNWPECGADPSNADVVNGLELYVLLPCVSAQARHGVASKFYLAPSVTRLERQNGTGVLSAGIFLAIC